MSAACAQCFADRRLQDWIRAQGHRGRCRWCGAAKARVVPLEQLGPLFRSVAETYEPLQEREQFDSAEMISTLLQDDWQIFSDRITCAPGNHLQNMAVALLQAGIHPRDLATEHPDYGDLFVRKELLRMSVAELFYARLEPLELPAEAAPPAEADFPPDTVGFAVADLGTTYPSARVFYRARPYDPDRAEPYAPEELGAPPPERSPAGRGNRAGSPVLYVSTDVATAVAEKRASPGQSIGIACIRLQRPQKVLNLVRLPYLKSPFFEEDLRWKVEALELLDSFGEELSKPVTADDTEEQYEISQEACDAIRAADFDGVAYPSGLGPGHNVFFFDAAVGRVTRRRIVRMVGGDGELETLSRPNE
jgi:RES domain-containing protein